MAFTIKIFEKDRYLFSLLKTRLETMFPDAYIIDAINCNGQTDCVNFSEFTRTIYDPRNIDMSDFKDAVPLCDGSGLIDCRRIAECLGLSSTLRSISPASVKAAGRSVALIPYVYIDDREAMIAQMLTDRAFNSDYSVRLDLMGKMRVPGQDSTGIRPGGMTKLLEQAGKRNFRPEDILAYCNMDKMGFMTPGATSGDDDVYDFGLPVIRKLIDASISLTKNSSPTTSVLAVFEGFRTGELLELISGFDEVTLLFPSRIGQENIGAKKLSSGIEQKLTSGRLNICYSEDLASFREDDIYEQAL